MLFPALRQWLEMEWFVIITTGKGNFVKSKLSWQILFTSFRSHAVIGSNYLCCHSDTMDGPHGKKWLLRNFSYGELPTMREGKERQSSSQTEC